MSRRKRHRQTSQRCTGQIHKRVQHNITPPANTFAVVFYRVLKLRVLQFYSVPPTTFGVKSAVCNMQWFQHYVCYPAYLADWSNIVHAYRGAEESLSAHRCMFAFHTFQYDRYLRLVCLITSKSSVYHIPSLSRGLAIHLDPKFMVSYCISVCSLWIPVE